MFVRAALRCVRLSFLPFFVSLLHEARCERRVCVLSLSVAVCVYKRSVRLCLSFCLCLSLARSLSARGRKSSTTTRRKGSSTSSSSSCSRGSPPASRVLSLVSLLARADQAKEATGRLKDHFVNVVDDETVAHVDRRVLLTRGSLSPSLSLSFPRSRARTHGKKPSPSSCQRESLTSTAVA